MAIQRRLEIDTETNTGTCFYCGGKVVPERPTITARMALKSKAVASIDYVCSNCGAEYHAEIGVDSKEIKEREIKIVRGDIGGIQALGERQKEAWL